MRKELAELQEELSLAHNKVHISEARVATALDKLTHMETLVNDRLLQDRNTSESDQSCSSPYTSTQSLDTIKAKLPRKSLNVFGPVQSYRPQLKNFWYPVAFSSNLKDDTTIEVEVTFALVLLALAFTHSGIVFRSMKEKVYARFIIFS
ncbi:chlorophyllide a oxygenase, chloroplastic-like [Mangifera indica]|uniref:chlorophyllide a oxygenase, chloroplastic-like n=1 Tax=Mangifera indica TaxID=29780 RepID=UPI001CFA1E32|nr:chlorophyllide a oxygenase, chloroplastic-like [Mangifera indica]